MGFADAIVALEDGRIVEVGSTQALLCGSTKLGIALTDEEPIREHADGIEVSQMDCTGAESFMSVPNTTDQGENALDSGRKNSDWSVYSYYFSSSGYKVITMFLASMAVWIFCTEFASRCTRFSLIHRD
jgi:hypothetical protein